MANKPSFDLGGLVNNIKSMVNPAGGSPNADPNDVLGVQLADLSKLVIDTKANHDEYSKKMSKDLSQINGLFNSIYTSLEAIRQGDKAPAEPAAEKPVKAAKPKKPAKAAEKPAADEAKPEE